MDTAFNYSYIHSAIIKYKQFGYTYVDVPWRAPMKIQRLTYPLLAGEDDVEQMVGSAEQSFLWLDLEGKLPKGKFVACTPCYRKESRYDELHRPYFMKVELYQNIEVNRASLEKMVADCVSVMYAFDPKSPIKKLNTAEGYDLELNNIEVGSYGIRTLENGHSWIYGTGLAEPRFSVAASYV